MAGSHQAFVVACAFTLTQIQITDIFMGAATFFASTVASKNAMNI